MDSGIEDHSALTTSLQTDNHDSTPPLCFLQAGCPSYHPTNSVKALEGLRTKMHTIHVIQQRYTTNIREELFHCRRGVEQRDIEQMCEYTQRSWWPNVVCW